MDDFICHFKSAFKATATKVILFDLQSVKDPPGLDAMPIHPGKQLSE